MNEAILKEFAAKYRTYLELKAEIEAYEKDLKQDIVKNLAESNDKELVMEGVKFAYVKPSTRRTFDSKRLQEEEPEVYDKYIKETQIKDTYRTTIVSM